MLSEEVLKVKGNGSSIGLPFPYFSLRTPTFWNFLLFHCWNNRKAYTHLFCRFLSKSKTFLQKTIDVPKNMMYDANRKQSLIATPAPRA